ncbi:transporter [Streptomyces johnsoniae]|uniref:Transporter n=1 Tax=Streptomyces johnsoniae TaxID=3075532 RepID=A0ABU2RYP1_9ACTN|nr:transporter [Streptomyces sp. DSM 41886]MDT0441876.1 transporter [Streptomyces sp. DSM 41886]
MGTAELSASSVAGTFLRLKLSLLRNGVRQSKGRSAAFVGSLVVAGLFGVLGLLIMVALRGHEDGPAAGVALVAATALGWAFMPLFVGAADETLDPGRLVMLPLRPRPLLTAQLVASLVGAGPLFTLLLVAGAVVPGARGGAATVVAVCAVALVLLTCTTLSRTLATANAGLLSSRKGRDLAVLSGLVVAFGIQGVNLGFSALADEDGDGLGPVAAVAEVARWVPPASAVDAVRAAGEGSWGFVAYGLGGTLLACGLLLLWWSRTLTRLMTAPDASTLQTPPESAGARGAAGRGLAAWLPEGRTGTVMRRALTYAWRDPKTKMGWAMSLGMGLLLPLVFAVQGNGSVYNACWVAALLGLQMYNQFGQDYSGFWLVAQSIGTDRDAYLELRGRALAIGLIGLPFTCVVVVGSAAAFGAWGSLPDGLGLALALLGALVAAGAVTSARFPYSIPQDNAMKNVAPGQGALAWFSIIGGMLAGGVLCAPVIALTVWAHAQDAAWTWALLPAGAGYGLLLAWAGLRIAAPMTAARLPEILAAVSRS